MAFSLQHTLVLLFLCSSCTSGKDLFISAHVGKNVTIHCTPPETLQDGVYMYRWLETQQTLTYLYKDGSFTPKDLFKGRLETNRVLENFTVSILNVTVQDTGVYWCVFNKKDINNESKQKTLLVVSGEVCPDYPATYSVFMVVLVVVFGVVIVGLLIALLFRRKHIHYNQLQRNGEETEINI